MKTKKMSPHGFYLFAFVLVIFAMTVQADQKANSTSGSSNTNDLAATEAHLKAMLTNKTSALSTQETNLNNGLATLDDKHKLAIGDRLSFKIQEDEDDPKPMIVADNGEVEVPYIGRVHAENKTCKQLAAEIKVALEKDYYYKATVSIAVDQMAKTRGRVYLSGALRMPGPQEILSDETLTLSKAILRAGGVSDFADKKNVKITRKTGPGENDRQTIVINITDILEKGKLDKDVELEPGDLILVPDRKIRF